MFAEFQKFDASRNISPLFIYYIKIKYSHSISINRVLKLGLKNGLDNVVYYGFEDFGNEPYILSDNAEDYDQNDFPDVKQDHEKLNVDCKHEYVSSKKYTSSHFSKVFSSK